jgi:glutaredoxin
MSNRQLLWKLRFVSIPSFPSQEKIMSKAVFYHAGCPVCVHAEQTVADALKLSVEKVHLGESKSRVAEAERLGVKSVPALVIDDQVFHINHGADLSVLK